MEQFKAVFQFEYFSYVKTKGYIITTILLAVLSIAISVVPTAIIAWNNFQEDRYVAEDTAAVAGLVDLSIGRTHDPRLLEEWFPDYVVMPAYDRQSALANVENGDFAWALVLDEMDFTVYVPALRIAVFQMENAARGYIREIYRRQLMSQWGIDPYEMDGFFEIEPEGSLVALGGGDATDFFINYIYAYLMVFLLYMAIAMYGQYIATSVVTEKSSKAIEVLITSVKPIYLMFGKVLGAVAAGFTQLFVLIAAGFGSFFINSSFWVDAVYVAEADMDFAYQWINVLNVEDMLFGFIYMAVFFVLGFLIYAFLYAAFASLAGRMEDISTITAWPVMFLIAAFIAGMAGIGNAGSTWMAVLSYIPFFTPVIMLIRFVMGAVGHVEALIGIAALIAGVFAMGYLSAKIYRMGILMHGNPPKFLEIIKMLWTAEVM